MHTAPPRRRSPAPARSVVPDRGVDGGRAGGRDPRRLARAPRRCGAPGLRRRRARVRVAAATMAVRPARGRWTYGFRRLEILSAQANGLLAPDRRHLDRIRRDSPTGFAERRAGRGRPGRRARGDRRQPGRDGAARACEPREPERARRVPARRDRPGGVHRNGGRGGAHPRHRVGSLRPDRRPLRRRAHVLGRVRVASRVDAHLPRGRADKHPARRRRARAVRGARGRRGARPARLDADGRISGRLRARSRCPGRRLPRDPRAARAPPGGAVRARALDAPGRARSRAGANRPLVPPPISRFGDRFRRRAGNQPGRKDRDRHRRLLRDRRRDRRGPA